MKETETTAVDHQIRINRVINYIQNNLDRPMQLEKLASIACFSPFHFHRVFSASVGESLNCYIRRIRLERAAMKLCYTKSTITDIAFNAGYETPSAFSKAFKQFFGTTPSLFRKDNLLTLQIEKSDVQTTNHTGDDLMKHEIQKRENTKVIYTRRMGKYKNAAEEAWKSLCDIAFPKNLVAAEAEFIGISYDNPELTQEEKLRYDACISITTDVSPEGDMGVMEVSGGTYAVFLHEGSYDNLQLTYNKIFGKWLPTSKCNLRDLPCFEKYLNSPEEVPPEELLTEIFIPLDK